MAFNVIIMKGEVHMCWVLKGTYCINFAHALRFPKVTILSIPRCNHYLILIEVSGYLKLML